MVKPLVSVIIPSYNNALLIEKCIDSIIAQSFKRLEIIVVDDCSTDDTIARLKRCNDKRLKVLQTKQNGGSAIARNKGIKNARGTYLFFIDGDCIAEKDWIAQGLKVFKKENCIGVEGRIQYVSKNYKPGVMDNVAENKHGGTFMGANIAFLKKVIDDVGGYDENMIRMQDRDIAFKVLKKGRIMFAKNMVVTHQKVAWTFKKKMWLAKECTKTNITLFKRYNDRNQFVGRVYQPVNLLAVVFPPTVLGLLFTKRFRKVSDLKVLAWTYAFVVVERFTLWKTAFKERIFLV